MWMPFPRFIDVTQLDVFVANCPPSVLRSDVAIIGMHPASFQKISANADILDDVARRIEGAPLLIVRHQNGKPVIEHVRGEEVVGFQNATALEQIRERDIAEVIRRPGSELPKHAGLHYEGPNGDHYEAFFRPGFAARSIEELDRLAFWLAPMLLGRKSILVDHWSMIAIAYHVGGYFSELGYPLSITVQTLQKYDENRDVLVRRLTSAFGTVDREMGAVLVSVNSSGRLARDVLFPAMTEIGFQNPFGVAIAQTPSPPEAPLLSLTKLSDDFVRYEPSKCPACAKGNSTLIPIQRDSYLLNLAAYIQPTRITRAAAHPSTEVVERYRGINAFCVHRTHSDGRHHAYFVDLLPMLETGVFRERLVTAVGPWHDAGIELIVHPKHMAGARLASMVAEELGVTRILGCDENRLQQLEGDDMEHLLAARRICLVDDVVISGARVYGYRNSLTAARRSRGAGEYELYCLVGVARATSEKALMGVYDMVHHTAVNPRFLSIEKLFLPHWGESHCRWCAELRILDGLPNEIQVKPLIHSRLEVLRGPGGLLDDIFLSWTNDPETWTTVTEDTWPIDEPAYRYMELSSRSVFGEVQGADLAVSVAAAIQWLRGNHRVGDEQWRESELDEVFHSPLAKVLDPQLYLAGRFYEPAIVASILRASKAHDIRAPGDDLRLNDRIEILMKAENSKGLCGELILAAAIDQLPRISRELLIQAHPDIKSLAQSIWEHRR